MTPQEFIAKWSKIQVKETAAAQSHFNDVCRLVGHPTPLEKDPHGTFFTFEASAAKEGGQQGRADAYYQGRFIWEYKGPHANLDKAYQQLLLYRESLGNPPLLIVSDTHTIIIHTNFTNTVKQTHTITFDHIAAGPGLTLLRHAFFAPEKLKPAQTPEAVTQATAAAFVAVVDAMKQHQRVTGETYAPEQLAHFVIRLLFCLFAEDLGLLPNHLFTQLVQAQDQRHTHFSHGLRNLFTSMRGGGVFGFYQIRHFDGGLFDDDFVPELPPDLGKALAQACTQDWSGIDPSIFGTLFERAIDEDKRAQLGAHYTSKEDILLIVEPVLMQPLRRRWQQARFAAAQQLQQGETAAAAAALSAFAAELAAVRVLDPACGSGNFLYLALQQLLDLQKEVIAFSGQHGLPGIPLTVGPAQLYGIEINPYAHELAQVTVWIGYLQWRFANGFGDMPDPILRPLQNIEHKDAILAYDEDGQPVEPTWPAADVIIGNPPFLGDKKMRAELGDGYVEDLRLLYEQSLPGQSDLVCYWFERARRQIGKGLLDRAGLIATQGIRGGANRIVLERIKNTGNIFLAYSDRDWILDGATVHVSIIAFDNGKEPRFFLDGKSVANINANLTSRADITLAERLLENQEISFIGTQKTGPFDLSESQAKLMLRDTQNRNSKSNADVIKPWINATDITRRSRNMWIIDFGTDMPLEQAAEYLVPFEYVRQNVKPLRDEVRRQNHRENWWRFGESRPGMRNAISSLKRFIVTPLVSKYRIFVWIPIGVIPENLLVVVARADDYFFGVLHSSIHEVWSREQGTQLREASSGQRYTPTTTFETFPFPWPPGQEPAENEDERVAAIAHWARQLTALRQGWLHPPGVGITISQKQVNKRTLTNLYNALTHYRQKVKGRQRNPHQWKQDVDGIIDLSDIEQLDHIHHELDQAVLAAYGWPPHLSDDQILERLLALNLERAAQQ